MFLSPLSCSTYMNVPPNNIKHILSHFCSPSLLLLSYFFTFSNYANSCCGLVKRMEWWRSFHSISYAIWVINYTPQPKSSITLWTSTGGVFKKSWRQWWSRRWLLGVSSAFRSLLHSHCPRPDIKSAHASKSPLYYPLNITTIAFSRETLVSVMRHEHRWHLYKLYILW